MGNANIASVLISPTDTDFYQGPAGFMGGGASFVAAAAFVPVVNTGQEQHIVGNRDIGNFRGWSFFLSDEPTGVGLNAEVGDGASMVNNLIGVLPLGELCLVHLVVAPGADAVEYYVQGNPAGTATIAGLASALAPTALTRVDGTAIGAGVQLLGFGYGFANWAPQLAALHYENCQRNYDFARLTILPPGAVPSDFDNRYSVREGANVPGTTFDLLATGAAGAPLWTPSSGTTDLTREGSGQLPSLFTLTNPKWTSIGVEN
jgi:hypothetical protein